MLGPFDEINFLVGPNNSGKSTVLLFLSKYLYSNNGKWNCTFDQIDIQLGKSAGQTSFGIAISLDAYMEVCVDELERTVLRSLANDGLIWLLPDSKRGHFEFDLTRATGVESALVEYQWGKLWSRLTGQSGGSFDRHWKPETLALMAKKAPLRIPPIKLVPAIRQITNAEEMSDYSGSGLVNELAKRQNPGYDEQHRRLEFEKVERFVQTVTDIPDAKMEVPFERNDLIVHVGSKSLPLSALGTGIHEVVMLAAFSTLSKNSIVCLEEPEIHLHPLLQRKLIRYLRQETSNQYFIATHSASILDAAPAAIFSVYLEDEQTKVRQVVTATDKFEICRQLGYQASDLLQCNAIIWVEGPSDRIYVNHWLSAVAPDLVEGADYSIMFYGGRLLSHLDASDEEVEEFISLRRLNRNVAILIDSDRSQKGKRVNATKRRVVSQLDDGFSWITAGREIENYVAPQLIAEALSSLYPKTFERLASEDVFAHALHFVKRGSGETITKADKVKVAHLVAAKPADLSVLDLKARVKELAQFIREASPR